MRVHIIGVYPLVHSSQGTANRLRGSRMKRYKNLGRITTFKNDHNTDALKNTLNALRFNPRILRYKSERLQSKQDAKLREKLAAEKGWKQDVSNPL